jgi:hypothetical protein
MRAPGDVVTMKDQAVETRSPGPGAGSTVTAGGRPTGWLVAGLLALTIAALGGGYAVGRASGEDLDPARAAGSRAGEKIGTARGTRRGYAAGLKQGKRKGYKQAYKPAYKRAYNEALEGSYR